MAKDVIYGGAKTPPKPKTSKVPASKSPFVITPETAKRFGVPVGSTSVDQRTATAMRETSNAGMGGSGIDPATKLADEQWAKLLASLNSGASLDFSTGGSGLTAAEKAAIAKANAAALSRQQTLADRGLVNSILSEYGKQANTNLDTRYANYLNNLNQGNTVATGQINTATQNLLNSLPTTYQPAVTPTWIKPMAANNAYQQYLASMGANTTDIGNLQQFNNATAQSNADMYAGINAAQNRVQQNYLDALRAGAGAQGTAALQTLATNKAAQEANAQNAYGTAQQNILATLLPLLVANPVASSPNVVANKPLNIPVPKAKKAKAKK